MRKELTGMGPAFIKMGQFLSTRSDLFDKSIVSELCKLQDDITPVHIDQLGMILTESYGRDWSDVFSQIDSAPLACASIGQVHMATLKDGGARVVVKIQKPCVARQIKDDIETLRMLNNLLVSVGSSRASEVENVLQQYEHFLAAELDYRQEMYHMIRFRETLEDQPVRVPRVYTSLCTTEVLVMEYVPSIKINDVQQLRMQGIDTRVIAEALVGVFLEMIVTHGYVHCDPHPGNIGVMAEDGETIVLYDFGNVIELSATFRKEIQNIIFAIYQKDVDEFVDILLKLNVFSAATDTLDIRLFFRSFFDYLETLNITTLTQSIRNQELFTSTSISQLNVDPDFLALFRVFSLLDGTCSQLNPDFNYIESLAPYSQDLFSDLNFFDYRAKKDVEKLQKYPALIRSTEQSVMRMQKQVNHLVGRTRTTERLLGVMAVTVVAPAFVDNPALSITTCLGAACFVALTQRSAK